jgi:hypothetical protein
MRVIEAPETAELKRGDRAVFLAGGITGCPGWQAEIIELLADTDLVLLNPRRKNFPIDDKGAAYKQIEWEYKHLRLADAVLFWFPWETLCPITLYELGAWSMANKDIFIGVHPDYQRRQDVEIQTKLVRPGIMVSYSLEDLAAQVKTWALKGE